MLMIQVSLEVYMILLNHLIISNISFELCVHTAHGLQFLQSEPVVFYLYTA